MQKLKIEQKKCIRCGACVVSYPEVFEFDKAGNVEVKGEIKNEKIEELKAICPVGAII